MEVRVGSGLPQEQGLWVWGWHKPSWRRSPLTLPQSCQNLHRTGKWTLGGHNRALCTRTREEGTAAPQETCLWCPGVSGEGMGWWWPAAGLGARTVAVHAWDLLREVTIIFITSTIVWPQINSREGTQLHPSTENWIKDLLSTVLPIRTRPSFPLSLSHQEASISLLSFSVRGQTD